MMALPVVLSTGTPYATAPVGGTIIVPTNAPDAYVTPCLTLDGDGTPDTRSVLYSVLLIDTLGDVNVQYVALPVTIVSFGP